MKVRWTRAKPDWDFERFERICVFRGVFRFGDQFIHLRRARLANKEGPDHYESMAGEGANIGIFTFLFGCNESDGGFLSWKHYWSRGDYVFGFRDIMSVRTICPQALWRIRLFSSDFQARRARSCASSRPRCRKAVPLFRPVGHERRLGRILSPGLTERRSLAPSVRRVNDQ